MVNRPLTLILAGLLAAAAVASACASKAESPEPTTASGSSTAATTAAVVTETRTPTPTPPSAAPHTGIASVDAALSAVATSDADRLAALVHYVLTPCAVVQQQLGLPPPCPAGVSDGSPVEAFGRAQCEGVLAPRSEAVDIALRTYASSSLQFYGAFAMPPTGGYDAIVLDAKYVIVFSDHHLNTIDTAKLLFLDDGGIVAAATGCGAGPADLVFGVSLLK